jgi:hypothetical protein
MFMSANQAPLYHALLRSMYPGPILISDKPGAHDVVLINRMMARDKAGVLATLKSKEAPTVLGSRIYDTSILDGQSGRGLWAYVKAGRGMVLGVWNVRDEKDGVVVDSLTTEDLASIVGRGEEEFAVVEMDIEQGTVKSAGRIRHSAIKAELGSLEVASFWLVPITYLGTREVYILGLIDKLVGTSAIGACELEDGECAHIILAIH